MDPNKLAQLIREDIHVNNGLLYEDEHGELILEALTGWRRWVAIGAAVMASAGAGVLAKLGVNQYQANQIAQQVSTRAQSDSNTARMLRQMMIDFQGQVDDLNADIDAAGAYADHASGGGDLDDMPDANQRDRVSRMDTRQAAADYAADQEVNKLLGQ